MSKPPSRPAPGAASGSEFLEGIRFTGSFHVGDSPIHAALRKLGRHLDEMKIPYAIAGAMALNAFGYRRATVDIDVLLTAEGLARFKGAWLGRGYAETFAGSRGVRDTEHGVPIDVLLSGDYPGDGKPKSVRFPDPALVAIPMDGLSVLPLERLVELKLASGLSAPHRLRDLADVLELIRVRNLDESLADRLDASVRDKYRELWHAARSAEPDEPR